MRTTVLFLIFWLVFPQFGIQGQTTDDGQACTDCHKDLISGQVIHPPAEEACDMCHEPNGNKHPSEGVKGFGIAEPVPGLCYMCHDEGEGKYVHAPVEEGECFICHSPHSTDNRALLLSTPTSTLCFECHDAEMAENPVNHKPISDGSCESCHNPHRSKERSLLKTSMPGLCFECHENTGEEMTASYLHPPFEDDCRNCHSPHGSQDKYLLEMTTINLCFECHDDVKTTIENEPVVHAVVSEKKACVNCHSPHASANEKFLFAVDQELCLECHNKSIRTETKNIRNIQEILTNSKVIHGAIEFGGCGGCHKPHTSVFPYLLQEAFPGGIYTVAKTENFNLCFDCHDAEMIEKEVTKNATSFRNLEQNLHFFHINGDKGRSCTACHDMHGSSNEHLITTEVNFGNWKMPLQYEVTENGGSCLTGCHAKKEYRRK